MKKIITSLVLILASTAGAHVTNFSDCFNDSTLCIDYIFGGGPDGVVILVDRQKKTPGWFGKRERLKEVPYTSNGSIMVIDPITTDTLYQQTFSSLFQEWLRTPESSEIMSSFENSFLVPLPNKEADIVLTLNDNRHTPIVSTKHRYRPDDELVEVISEPLNEYRYIHKGNDPKSAIDVAILAEGYTEEEKDDFFNDSQRMVDEILRYEPFVSNKDKFNFIAVMTPSKESGVSIPLEKKWLDTAFGSHYSTFYSARYLTTPQVHKLNKALACIPYEHIVVLANTDNYGGGGIYNSYLMSAAKNQHSLPVTVHEFGHSFGGLADEYFYAHEESNAYPLDVEPWEPNITTQIDFPSKWEDLMGSDVNDYQTTAGNTPDKVGLFEGGGYRTKGIWRPVETCRMRDNYYPDFCPVCRRALSRIIDFYSLNK